MKGTLKLAERTLALGRRLQRFGIRDEAQRILTRLCSLRELPGDIAAEAQFRLARLSLQRRDFARARQLAAALAQGPNNARFHFLLATATRLDRQCDPERALIHYRHALKLRPDQTRWLTDYGLLALRLGRTQAGLMALRRAFDVNPDDAAIVGKIVSGLQRQRYLREARTMARASLFRNPRDVRFRQLWNDVRFHELCEAQERDRPSKTPGHTAPRILPFVQLTSKRRASRRRRSDGPALLPSPHLKQRDILPDQQRAT